MHTVCMPWKSQWEFRTPLKWQIPTGDLLILQAASIRHQHTWSVLREVLLWYFLAPSVFDPCAVRHTRLCCVSLVAGCWQIVSHQPLLTCARHVTGTCVPLNPSAQQSTDASCLAWNNVEDREKKGKRRKHYLRTIFSRLLLTHFPLACMLLSCCWPTSYLLFIFPLIN